MWFFQQLLFDPRMCLLEWPDRCLQNPKELEAFQMIGRQVLLKQTNFSCDRVTSCCLIISYDTNLVNNVGANSVRSNNLTSNPSISFWSTHCLKSDGTCLYSDILSFVLAHRNFVSKTGCY